MIYARIEADGSITLHDLDPALVARWVAEGNPKATIHRPLVVDAQPTPSASQVVVRGAYVVEPTQVRQPWVLRDKTADELERDSATAELALLQQVVAALQAGTGTAGERLQRLERVCVWLLRQAARRGVA